jgi:hypothetical protein
MRPGKVTVTTDGGYVTEVWCPPPATGRQELRSPEPQPEPAKETS